MRLVQDVKKGDITETGVLLTWDRFAAQVYGATDLYIGTGPALPNEPDATVALTQHGAQADYRSLFHRSATELQMQSIENEVTITMPEYKDAITLSDTGVLWRRSIENQVVEESMSFITEQT
jgi:hypothetical protein